MENDITSRVEQLLTHLELSPSSFADGIGIPRAVMSHILSRRNKPSLEVIQKILIKFPQINSLWLLNGKGDMIQLSLFEEQEDATIYKTSSAKKNELISNANSTSNTITNASEEINVQPSESSADEIISNSLLMNNDLAHKNIMEKEIKNNNPMSSENASVSQSYENPLEEPKKEEKKKEEKKIEKIIIFYSDKSFSIHLPE